MNLLALFLILLLILGATAAFCASGYFLSTALSEARPKFPPPFQDEESSRYAIDIFIWERTVSANARRNYLLSLLCFSLAAGCGMLLAMIHGSPFAIAMFGAFFFVMACTALMRWIKYRAGS